MSEPKLISPMLDDFDMGGPISNHDGVRCCPAMRKNSDEKYIVKIISVPASQTKLDALLLTGAYPNQNAALGYFKELAEGIVAEKKILDNLSQLEGFISFEDYQVIPMDDAIGYDVYLLSQYRTTLERKNAKQPMTQLAAVNLGLDLCAALSCCRRCGYMFVDLKPSNIYIVGDNEYRIGDLGFVRLNSLKYESLPDKYRSCYTAPEAEDAFASLNDTMDVYSAGLILYQVFNGGQLPFSGNSAPTEAFEAPVFADEEMAAIILKACAPDPAERWEDPVQMGQAIVSYMQKNGVSDTLLVAQENDEQPAEEAEDHDVPAVDSAEEDITDILEIVSAIEAEPEPEPELESGSEPEPDLTLIDLSDEEDVAEPAENEPVATEEMVAEEITAEPTSETAEDAVSVIPESEAPEIADDEYPRTEESEPAEDTFKPDVDTSEEPVGEETTSDEVQTEFVELSFLDELEDTENIIAEATSDDEITAILEQVDALVTHQIPDPVVAPEPMEIKLPEDTIPEDTDDNAEPENVEADVALVPAVEEDAVPDEDKPYVPRKRRTGLVWLIVLVILALLAGGGYYFYTNYYIQEITALELTGSEDTLKVQITTDIDETLLSVVCTDSHGDKISAPVVGGTAVFSGLASDTAYTVSLEVDGLHKLVGTTSKVYSTPIQTKIAQVSVVTGSESGSVILSFAVEGPDSDQWNVIYSAEGEAERVTTFPAHMVTLTGLTVGKEYTFRLEPVEDVYLDGDTETTYVAKDLICAENLHIASCADGSLTAQWNAPAGVTVAEWAVRCYSDTGYDETIFTSETSATFANINDSDSYTVEVTAADMSVNQRVNVSANSVTLSDFTVDDSKAATITLKWSANRDIPKGGWTVRYSVNGVNAPSSVTTKKNSVKISAVPNGNYVFSIYDSDGNSVLGGPFTHTQSAAAGFNAYGLTQSNITMQLCKSPSSSTWSYQDLADEDFTNSFAAGQRIGMVLTASKTPITSDNDVTLTYAIYDENDNLVSFSHDSQIWQSMWYKKRCELNLTGIPVDIGTYKVVLLIDGAEVGSQIFEIIP